MRVDFFADKSDFQLFLVFAQSLKCNALPELVKVDVIPELGDPAEIDLDSIAKHEYFYLMPGDFAAVEAFYKEVEFSPGQSKLLPHTSPVIEVLPGELSAGPQNGRLFFCQSKMDPMYATTKSLFAELRKYIRHNWRSTVASNFYVGPGAADFCRKNKCQPEFGGVEIPLE